MFPKTFLLLSLSLILFSLSNCKICIGDFCEGTIVYDDGYPKEEVIVVESVPDNVTGFGAMTISTSQIQLSWAASTGADNYTIYISTDNITFNPVIPDVTSSPYNHTGLTPNTPYYYIIKANNSTGSSDNSSVVTTTTNQIPLPDNVTGVGATTVSTTQIDLTWTAATGADNYTVYISTDNITFNPVTPDVTSSPYNHTGLTPGTPYYYIVQAKNAAGSSDNSSVVSATTISILVDISADITSVTEGDSGFQTITLTATQSQVATSNTNVSFTSTSVPADAATGSGITNYTRDWQWVSGSTTITAGSTSNTTTLRVYGDEVDEDDETIYINTSVSGAGSENGTQTVNISIIDDDTADYRFQHGGSNLDNTTVTEQGTVGSITNTDQFQLKLKTRPATGVVVLAAESTNTGEYTVSPDNLTWDSDNWSTYQYFTVTGVQDNVDDGLRSIVMRVEVVTSATADTKWHSINRKTKDVDVYNVVAPILDNVTSGIGQITAYWTAFDNATGYKLYYDTNPNVSTSDSYFDIASNKTSYIHSGRIPGTTYYYALVATTASGDTAMSLEQSTSATAFPGCDELGYRSDNDTDLLAHYPFENNGEDVLDTNGDNRYDMTNLMGTMQYTPGCATGQALYIDSTSGVMRNDNFTDTNIGGDLASGNFTISFWAVRDGDMRKFSSAVNTGLQGAHAPTGDWSTKTQFDVGSGGKIRWLSQYATLAATSGLTQNEWYYIVGTSDASGRGTLYVDGVQIAYNASFQGNFKALMVGVNRSADYTTRYWKGYVDELKVYKRTMSIDEIINKCFFESNNCGYLLTTAPTLTATPRSTAIDLSWNQLPGSDNATIYWRTSGGAFEGSPAAPTASDNVINVADNQTSYSLTGLTNGDYYHFVIFANNRNGSSPISSVTGNVQPN